MNTKKKPVDKKYVSKKETGLKSLCILIFLIVLLWCIFWLVTVFAIEKWEDRGTFGDMFGALNSLFSGLALAGIIYTILLQKEELKLQRLELVANRQELSRSARAQENSEVELRRQADNLKAGARLNALSTLMNYYSERAIKYASYETMRNEADGKYEKCKNEIEVILDTKS